MLRWEQRLSGHLLGKQTSRAANPWAWFLCVVYVLRVTFSALPARPGSTRLSLNYCIPSST